MPTYVFYPTRTDGLAGTFESRELPEDDVAIDYAAVLLLKHESAVSVVVYTDNRKVATIPASPAGVVAQAGEDRAEQRASADGSSRCLPARAGVDPAF